VTQAVTVALKEWHVVAEAIARGEQVVTIRKGGIREKDFLVEGTEPWLFPTWEHEAADEVKPAWRRELDRSRDARPADGSIPVRCRCTVVQTWELTEPGPLHALDDLHGWTAASVEQRLRWRPRKPLRVLLLRAAVLDEPMLLAPSAAYGGCRSWVELEDPPPHGPLVPALTDEAFERVADDVRSRLADFRTGVASAVPA
jgi:hypothetical protein